MAKDPLENTPENTPVQARILAATVINGHAVACNRVALISSDIADPLISAGAIDTSEAAVTYALTLDSDVIDTTIPD